VTVIFQVYTNSLCDMVIESEEMESIF